MKIVVTDNKNLNEEQKKRLAGLGDVTYYDTFPQNAEEYLERVKGANIICSGRAGLQDAYPQLKNVYITVNFVSLAFLDLSVLTKNNVKISNAPGANKYAVTEWIIGMMIVLTRNLYGLINQKESLRKKGLPRMPGAAGKKIAILGYGNIGKHVGEVVTTMGAEIVYFKRGDNLNAIVKDADIVIDVLASNPSTQGMLNENFFRSMKQGSYFITVSAKVVDNDALLKLLDENHLSGAASDCGGMLVGDTDDATYQKLLQHKKVLVTPHVAHKSDMTNKTAGDIMIDNVEAWIKGTPTHLAN